MSNKQFMTKDEQKRDEMKHLTLMYIKVFKAICEENDFIGGLEDIAIVDAIIYRADLHHHPDWFGCEKVNFEELGITEWEALEDYLSQMAYKWLGIENLWEHPLWTKECKEYVPTLREYLIQNYNYHIEVINALEKEVIEYYETYADKMKPDISKDGYIWGYDIEDEGLRLCDAIWNDCPLFSNSLLESLIEKIYENKIRLK